MCAFYAFLSKERKGTRDYGGLWPLVLSGLTRHEIHKKMVMESDGEDIDLNFQISVKILCKRDILKTVSTYTQLVTLYVYLCTYLPGCKINTFFCRGSMTLCTKKIGVDQLHLEVHIFL